MEHVSRKMAVGQIAGNQIYLKMCYALSPAGMQLDGRSGDCLVSEVKSNRVFRPPFFDSLSRTEQDRMIRVLLDFCG